MIKTSDEMFEEFRKTYEYVEFIELVMEHIHFTYNHFFEKTNYGLTCRLNNGNTNITIYNNDDIAVAYAYIVINSKNDCLFKFVDVFSSFNCALNFNIEVYINLLFENDSTLETILVDFSSGLYELIGEYQNRVGIYE